jgi:hypothetical protein
VFLKLAVNFAGQRFPFGITADIRLSAFRSHLGSV